MYATLRFGSLVQCFRELARGFFALQDAKRATILLFCFVFATSIVKAASLLDLFFHAFCSLWAHIFKLEGNQVWTA